MMRDSGGQYIALDTTRGSAVQERARVRVASRVHERVLVHNAGTPDTEYYYLERGERSEREPAADREERISEHECARQAGEPARTELRRMRTTGGFHTVSGLASQNGGWTEWSLTRGLRRRRACVAR